MPLLLAALLALAPADRATRVDHGVLRWADDGGEVAVFGVNYYPPFAGDYRELRAAGQDPRAVIDQDLRHLQRLGLTCLRLHCWDREISDRQGNLLDNDHLAVLDHLVAAAKTRGIYTVLTPIAWWGAAPDSPGFSNAWTMHQMTTDPQAREAQRRYLAQFVQHKNRETGLTYAEDPAVLAFEMINEPIYPPNTPDEQVVAYINALLSAVRDTGCRKPLFYSYFSNRLTAVGKSQADGITFGWYPTGLVNGRMITENALPLVNDLAMMRDLAVAEKVRAVYEFDAADVGASYLYPAMARSFRGGGAQFACQFQYDAWPLASTNVNWRTHFLSLPFAPKKALSFAIAAEAFRRVPRGQRYGVTPEADHFGAFRVSYPEALSELVTATDYLASNDTRTPPPAPERLERVWGCGSNPAVSYDGTGAWFLDRVQPGAWRLEVYPDAVWVADPFGVTRRDRETARVVWAERRMTIHLPDLGTGFTVEPLEAGNSYRPVVKEAAFGLRPGVYRVTRTGAPAPGMEGAFFAPPQQPGLPPAVWHDAPDAFVRGASGKVSLTAVGNQGVPELWAKVGETWTHTPLAETGRYQYEGALPPAAMAGPAVQYGVVVPMADGARAFPGNLACRPGEIQGEPKPFLDVATLTRAPELRSDNPPDRPVTASLVDGALRLSAPKGFDAAKNASTGLRLPATAQSFTCPAAVRFRVRATQPATGAVELALVQEGGEGYGYDLPLTDTWQDVDVPVTDLKPLWQTKGGTLDPAKVKQVSICFGTWLDRDSAELPQGVEVARVSLVPWTPSWTVPVEPVGPPVPLLRPAPLVRRGIRQAGGSSRVVRGPGGQPAFELSHKGFGPAPDSMGVTTPIDVLSPGRSAALGTCDTLRVTLRGGTPAATAVELVLVEDDGTPWGTNVPATTTWQTVDIPLASLRYFSHWHTIAGRGGEVDHLRPDHAASLHLAIGTWLNPASQGQPWRLQIADVSLVKR